MIDEGADSLKLWHETSSDLVSMKQVCKNAMKQYIKSRSVPSSESVKKSKDINFETMVGHPVFRKPNSVSSKGSKDDNPDMETNPAEERSKMLMALKTYKPTSTIF